MKKSKIVEPKPLKLDRDYKPLGDKHWEAYGQKVQVVSDKLKFYLGLWLPTLGLERWEVTADYCPAPPDQTCHDMAADVKVQWKYRTVHIRFVMPNLTECTDQRLEYIVVHELCHVLVNQLRRRKHNHRDMLNEERVVTEMAYAFIRTRQWVKGKGGK